MHLYIESFKLNLTVLRFFGLYPFKTYSKIYRIYTYFVYYFLTTLIPLAGVIYIFLAKNIDIVVFSENMFLVAQVAMFIIKFRPFITKVDAIRGTIQTLETPLFNMFRERQMRFVTDCIYTCKMIYWIFTSSCVLALITWGFKPLFMGLRKWPIDVWLPINLMDGKIEFVLIYAYIIISVGNGAVSSGAMDPLIAGLAHQATTQVRVLKDNLQFLLEDADEIIENKAEYKSLNDMEKDILRGEIIYQKICLCIKHHNAILEFIDRYEDTYSQVVFCQFIVSIFVICTTCYVLTLVEPFSVPFMSVIPYLACMLYEIFIFCYYGTILYEESETIATAIYMGQWYNLNMKCKRALINIMEGGKRPMKVTAGKVLDLSLETFTTILRRSYSFFAVLKNYKVD